MIRTTLLALGLTLAATAAQAAMYKWTDASGNVQYGQFPPAGVQAERISSSGTSHKVEPQDSRSFEKSWNMLVKIRNRLHYISQRKNDQLFFELQEEMAEAFGYTDSDGMLAVEHFMRHVYSHLQTIAVVTDLFFDHVREVLGVEGSKQKEKQLEKNIYE